MIESLHYTNNDYNNNTLTHAQVIQKKVNFSTLKEEGNLIIDMHVHTRFSDSFNRVRSILDRAEKKGIGIAITDHNEIKGVLRAYEIKDLLKLKTPVIPGIEISTSEGPHILLYFSNVNDLINFYENHVEQTKNKNPHTNINLTIPELIRVSKGYDCIVSLAHPFSLSYTNVPKNIIKGYIDPSFLNDIHAIEVLNGVIKPKLNEKAIDYAHALNKSITGGSDAHSLFEIGKVVTYAKANSIPEFFDQIKNKKANVMGKPLGNIKKMPSVIKCIQKHMVFLFPTLPLVYQKIIVRSARYNKPMILNKIKKAKSSSINLAKNPIMIPKKIIYQPIKTSYQKIKSLKAHKQKTEEIAP